MDPARVAVFEGDAERTVLWTSHSGLTEPLQLVVRDAGSWAELWREIWPAAPSVDFDEESVVVLAMGQKTGSASHVTVDSVRITGETGEVFATSVELGAGSEAATAVHMVRVPRFEGKAKFYEGTSESVHPPREHPDLAPGAVFVAVWEPTDSENERWGALNSDTMRIHARDLPYIQEAHEHLAAGTRAEITGLIVRFSGVDPNWPFHLDPLSARASAPGYSVPECTSSPLNTPEEVEEALGFTAWGSTFCGFSLTLVDVEELPTDFLPPIVRF